MFDFRGPSLKKLIKRKLPKQEVIDEDDVLEYLSEKTSEDKTFRNDIGSTILIRKENDETRWLVTSKGGCIRLPIVRVWKFYYVNDKSRRIIYKPSLTFVHKGKEIAGYELSYLLKVKYEQEFSVPITIPEYMYLHSVIFGQHFHLRGTKSEILDFLNKIGDKITQERNKILSK